MDRKRASELLRSELDQNGLIDWKIRLNQNPTAPFLGICLHKDKCIALNAHHVDQHPEVEIINTIKHEVAHALTPGHGHDEVWAEKARSIGCDNVSPCASFGLSASMVDAIRSGADVEVTVNEQVVRSYDYKISKLKDMCQVCGADAIIIDTIVIPESAERGEIKRKVLLCGHIRETELPMSTPFHTIMAFGDPQCDHEWLKTTCLKCGGKRPYQYQIEGMRFVERALTEGRGAGLFDDMGLGKTLQAIGLVKFHPELWPVCIAAKSAIKFNWFKAFLDWAGDDFVAQIIQTSKDIVIPGLKVYIISYDMLVPKIRKSKNGKTINQGFDVQKLIDAGIKTLIMDECQQIKNVDSTRTQQIRKLAKTCKVLALSGTPWKNNFAEYYSVMSMINNPLFGSYKRFEDRWVETYWDGNKYKKGGCRDIPGFKEYTKDFVIRRERATVLPELPIIDRQKLYIQLNEMESKVYDDINSDFVKWWNQCIIDGTDHSNSNSMHLLAELNKMRHVTGLAKIPATLEFVDEFLENSDNPKLLIGVHHIDVGETLVSELKRLHPKVPIIQITGAMNALQKFEAQEEFNRLPKVICIASTLAAGEGMNLQTANNVLMHERQWNPQNEQQFEDRVIRIGQDRNQVTGTYVLGVDTVDDLFDKIIEGKRNRFHLSMNEDEKSNPGWHESDLLVELANAIVQKYKKKHGEIKLVKAS